MGVCHGMYAITPIRIARPPLYFLVGNQDEVKAGAQHLEIPALYRALFESGGLEVALCAFLSAVSRRKAAGSELCQVSEARLHWQRPHGAGGALQSYAVAPS
jgi:hypothetical protein